MARWQAAMEPKRGFLGRVVDIGAELFAMAATCVRAEAQRVEALFEALWTNTDGVDAELARNVLKGRYTWLEEGIIDQSEATGPWIANWEPGESTESDLSRRFLTVAKA
jgi:hypothetical protein